ncbi:TonB-dependent receptor [uncultured Polaribacter sp.]|uniref:TonB-dependent receptor family protein n=1 Tax=uncultured Polaribacter sp. TaxID=174711 RepID=UPI00261B995E|nr:TonB-dependent receptor [uncultured Polaribacter sp.]
MKIKILLGFLLCFQSLLFAQYKITGKVVTEKDIPINKVQIYDQSGNLLGQTGILGKFSFAIKNKEIGLIFYAEEFRLQNKYVTSENYTNLNVVLAYFSEDLSEIQIQARKEKVFELKRLKDVEGTSIFAGKKTEVVLVNQSAANLATNNARQIYNQIAGLNIFQNDDAGLQLNIGGRGLDPNRTANFNTRQNGYDISADVLGYPESYYTPATEGLDEIQIVRGAASLQYGTQFGGLINFITKKPSKKPFELITRNTAGSFGLFANFTSVSGTKGKFSYYTYVNYKRGDGFRPNSNFESKNAFANFKYAPNDKDTFSVELTYLDYLAKQAGGLTDTSFNANPFQSNRSRNWFKVDWFLYNLKWEHKFNSKANFSFNFFGLNASRKAIGFRNRRVDLPDSGGARELLIGDFNNFGFEARFLKKYTIANKKATFLIGTKFYKAENTDSQGPGTADADANFSSAIAKFPDYRIQGEFTNPNLNLAFFGENIFYFSDKFSVTPGARLEYIKTASNGLGKITNTDNAGNPIGSIVNEVDNVKERSFILLGLGASYKKNKSLEFYGNISQNYRSITFSDINIVNPANAVDVNLEDENGFSTDFGLRGNWNNFVSYDFNVFGLFYKNRIGFLFTEIPPVNNLGQLRTNIGDARILGVESVFDFNLKKVLQLNNDFVLNYFINTSFINSEYTNAITNGILGKRVEFVPDVNLKTGLKFGYKNFTTSLQYTYLSSQFTDAQNSGSGDISGIIGEIPAYSILDFSLAYKYKIAKIEGGVNNLLNANYFTRRATGYPGPGIIPSAPRNFYLGLELKF